MPNWDSDSNECPGCGIDMEVIGPPGPRHREDCPYQVTAKTQEREEVDNESVTQWLNVRLVPGRTSLHQMFDEILLKHHRDDLDDWEF